VIHITDSYNMAVVFSNQRKLGKIWPNEAGAIIAATMGGRRLGCFTTQGLAVAALMDIADKPLESDPWCEWCEAIAESLSPDSNALTGLEHLVEQPPVRMAMEMLLSPW